MEDDAHQGVDVHIREDLNLEEPIPDPSWVPYINERLNIILEGEVGVKALEEMLKIECQVEELDIYQAFK